MQECARARDRSYYVWNISYRGALSRKQSLRAAASGDEWILHLRPDDISAVISAAGMCGCEIYEASSLMLAGHPRLFALQQDARDKRGVRTVRRDRYRDSRPVNGGLHASFA